MKKLNLKILSIIVLGLAGIVLSYIIFEINNTKKSLAESLLQKPMESAQSNLKSFFQPVQSALLSIKGQAELGLFDSITPQLMNRYFGPITLNYSQISSIGIANIDGFEYDVLPHDSLLDNRVIKLTQWGKIEQWSTWKINYEEGHCKLIKEWEDTVKEDPRKRSWFKGAINTPNGQINWAEPYLYNTTYEIGTTASISVPAERNNPQRILALDLTISDLIKFTETLKVSPNGEVFLLTKDGKYIGRPKDFEYNDSISGNHSTLKLKSIYSVANTSAGNALSYWNKHNQPSRSFAFENKEKKWWGKMSHFELSPKNFFIVGVIVPETDLFGKVDKTKKLVITSFIFVLILTGMVVYWYSKSRKTNLLLSLKNEKINQQKSIIQRKSDEIVDSIKYAKRIQKAILPQEREVKRKLPNSFILYKPKDIIAGDFYWLEEKNDWILFAAADCTGHGVPGAMVSVICKNALNQAVREHNEVDPGRILESTRKIVTRELDKSTNGVNDGMDIALCALKNGQLKYAGANNPLWIIRKGSETIEEYKGSKQPVGKFDYSYRFETHNIKLNKGDTFYIFSDGYTDQFGGKKGKKFNSANFKKLLLRIQGDSIKIQKDKINQAFEEWKEGLPQLDDVCVIGIQI